MPAWRRSRPGPGSGWAPCTGASPTRTRWSTSWCGCPWPRRWPRPGRRSACPGGDGLERFLRGLGALLAAHAKYAHLLLERSGDSADAREIRAAVQELTGRALAAGTLNPGVTVGDVMSLVWGMRGLTETADEIAPGTWQRFLDIHLAGLRTAGPLSATPSMSPGQLAELLPRP